MNVAPQTPPPANDDDLIDVSATDTPLISSDSPALSRSRLGEASKDANQQGPPYSGLSFPSQSLIVKTKTVVTTQTTDVVVGVPPIVFKPPKLQKDFSDPEQYPLGNCETPLELRKFLIQVEAPSGVDPTNFSGSVEFQEQPEAGIKSPRVEKFPTPETGKKRGAPSLPSSDFDSDTSPCSKVGNKRARSRHHFNNSPCHSESSIHGYKGILVPSPKIKGMDDNPNSSLSQFLEFSKAYENAPALLQAYIMFQLMRRTLNDPLRYVIQVALSELHCDPIATLGDIAPFVLKYLDTKSLCRAACVSKVWRKQVDSNAQLWKDRLFVDGLCTKEEIAGLQTPLHERPEFWGMKKPPPEEIRKQKGKVRKTYCTRSQSKSNIVKLKIPQGSETSSESPGQPISLPPDEEYHLSTVNAPTRRSFPLPLEANHPFKSQYWSAFQLEKSWRSGKYKRISFQAHSGNVVTCLFFSGRRIISGSDDNTITIWDAANGQLVRRLEGHEGGVWALAVYGDTVVSGSTDRSVRVWDATLGRCSHIFWGHTSTVRCCKIVIPRKTADGRLVPEVPVIVTGSRDHTLKVWRLPAPGRDPDYLVDSGPNSQPPLEDPFLMYSWTGHAASVRAVDGWGRWVVSGSYDSTVMIWDLLNGQHRATLTGHTQKVYSVAIEENGTRCASGSMDGTVRVWNIEDATTLFILDGHSSLVGLLSVTSDHIISAAADTTLRVWNPHNGKLLSIFSGHNGAITCFQAMGNRVVSGSDGCLKIWSLGPSKTHGKGFHHQGCYEGWVRDLLENLTGCWQLKFDRRRCVAAVARGQQTFFEVLDFEPE